MIEAVLLVYARFVVKATLIQLKKKALIIGSAAHVLAKKTISLRKGSFFEKSKLTFESILCLIYCWIYECSHSFIQQYIKHRMLSKVNFEFSKNEPFRREGFAIEHQTRFFSKNGKPATQSFG